MNFLHRLFERSNQRPALDTPAQSAARAAPVLDEHRRAIDEAGAHDSAGRHAASLAVIARAVTTAPRNPELTFARAATLEAWGRLREARNEYVRIADSGFRQAEVFTRLGWIYLETGDIRAAEDSMRQATAAEPEVRGALYGLASVLLAKRSLAEAVAIFERLLKSGPNDVECLISIAECSLRQNDLPAVESYLQRALALDANRSKAWWLHGISLQRQGRYAESLQAFTRAAQIESSDASNAPGDSFAHVAIELRNAGRWQEALDVLETGLAQHPAVSAHRAYADTLLASGRLTEGWHHYEFRWLIEPLLSVRAGSHLPEWSGQDLRGRNVLLRIEQGFGDTIQWLRYAPYVKALGAKVLLGRFSDLAPAFPGVDRVFEDETPDIDYYVNLASLPRIFGTDLDSIPADIPYLHADAALAKHWASRITGDQLKIGLVWAGNPGHAQDRGRSIALSMLTPLLEIEGVQFCSLQKGPVAEQTDSCPAAAAMIKLGPELGDFGDTAAVISHLDLVLCVDTAVAHLAGAMGKPVWLLVAQPSDWRWLQAREDTPWYPTMRLFRQRTRGDWDEVIGRVKTALEQWVHGDSSVLLPPQSQHAGQAKAKPTPKPLADPVWAGHRRGLSAVAETRMGIVQYLPDESEVGAAIGWYGEYLQPQVDLLVQMIRPGATVMEVGAGIGAHALPLAAAVGPTGHLMLYETRPVMRRILQQNLAANGVANVTLMRRSLGLAEASYVAAASGAPKGVSTVAWPSSESLDELQLERLDGLKIGADVAAMEVLDGTPETLWRLRPWMFIAVAGEPMVEELSRWAKGFGYRCWRMETRMFNAQNFNRRDDDIFGRGSALALFALPEETEQPMALDGSMALC